MNNVELNVKKRVIAKSTLDLLFSSLFFFLVAGMAVLAAFFLTEDEEHRRRILYFVVPIIAGIGLVVLFISLTRLHVFYKIRKIKIFNTHLIAIDCSKIRFIRHPWGRYTMGIIGLHLITSTNKKYTYIFERMISGSKETCLSIEEQLRGKNQLECYCDSRIIARLDIIY